MRSNHLHNMYSISFTTQGLLIVHIIIPLPQNKTLGFVMSEVQFGKV